MKKKVFDQISIIIRTIIIPMSATKYYVVANNPTFHKSNVAYVFEHEAESPALLYKECQEKLGVDVKVFYDESNNKLDKIKLQIGGHDEECKEIFTRSVKMCVEEFKKNGIILVQFGKEDEQKNKGKSGRGGVKGKGGKSVRCSSKNKVEDDTDEDIKQSKKKNNVFENELTRKKKPVTNVFNNDDVDDIHLYDVYN